MSFLRQFYDWTTAVAPYVFLVALFWKSTAVAVLIATLSFAFIDAVMALLRRRRSLAAARDSVRDAPIQDSRHPLRAGEQTISGVVEFEGAREHAMRVEITQEGREFQHEDRNKITRWHHRWTEVERTIKALSFVVVTDAGERVRVEPDETSLLWDDLEEDAERLPPSDTPPRRVRVATLSRGERVWVRGRVRQRRDQGYRTASGEGWEMRAPPLFVTTVPLESYHQKRAAMHRSQASTYGVFALLLGLMLGCWADRAHGHSELGTITSVGRIRTRDWANWEVSIATPSGRYSERTFDRPAVHSVTPVRRGILTSNMGESFAPTIRERSLLGLLVLFMAMTKVVLVSTSRDRLPWYRRPGEKLVECGSGRLD